MLEMEVIMEITFNLPFSSNENVDIYSKAY